MANVIMCSRTGSYVCNVERELDLKNTRHSSGTLLFLTLELIVTNMLHIYQRIDVRATCVQERQLKDSIYNYLKEKYCIVNEGLL
jgi:uncharacterized membrane protein YoaT (DUF817 family)